MNIFIKDCFLQAGGTITEDKYGFWTYTEDLNAEEFANLLITKIADNFDDKEALTGAQVKQTLLDWIE